MIPPLFKRPSSEMEGHRRAALYEGIYNSRHSSGQAAPLDGLVASAGQIHRVALHSSVHLETPTLFASFLGAGENDAGGRSPVRSGQAGFNGAFAGRIYYASVPGMPLQMGQQRSRVSAAHTLDEPRAGRRIEYAMAELHMCMSDALDAVCLLRTEQQAKHMTWGLGSGSGEGQAAVLHRDKTRRKNTRKSRTSSKTYGLQDLARHDCAFAARWSSPPLGGREIDEPGSLKEKTGATRQASRSKWQRALL